MDGPIRCRAGVTPRRRRSGSTRRSRARRRRCCVAVPPDLSQRLDNAGLLDVVLDTRELAHARAPPADRPSRRCRTRRPTAFVSASGAVATSSTGGQHERSALPHPRTGAHRHRRGPARARRRSGLVHHAPVAARRAPGRGRVDAGRGHGRAAARADHLRPLAAGSRSRP